MVSSEIAALLSCLSSRNEPPITNAMVQAVFEQCTSRKDEGDVEGKRVEPKRHRGDSLTAFSLMLSKVIYNNTLFVKKSSSMDDRCCRLYTGSQCSLVKMHSCWHCSHPSLMLGKTLTAFSLMLKTIIYNSILSLRRSEAVLSYLFSCSFSVARLANTRLLSNGSVAFA